MSASYVIVENVFGGIGPALTGCCWLFIAAMLHYKVYYFLPQVEEWRKRIAELKAEMDQLIKERLVIEEEVNKIIAQEAAIASGIHIHKSSK